MNPKSHSGASAGERQRSARSSEGETRLASDSRTLILKVDPQTVGATQFVVGVETVPPGAPFPTHKHPNQEEILMVATYQHPLLGQERVARHYIRFGHTEVLQGRPTPLLGEHTREVLQDVGFTDSAIAKLYAKGVVKTETQAAGG
jgi:hypothetical protein